MSGGDSHGISISPHRISSGRTATDPSLHILVKAVPSHRSGTKGRGRKSALNWEVPHVHSLLFSPHWRHIGRGDCRLVNRTALSSASAGVLWIRFSGLRIRVWFSVLLSAAGVCRAALIPSTVAGAVGDRRATPQLVLMLTCLPTRLPPDSCCHVAGRGWRGWRGGDENPAAVTETLSSPVAWTEITAQGALNHTGESRHDAR
jgi:hypothetical protein